MSLTRNQIIILVLGLVLVAGVIFLFIYGTKNNSNEVSGTVNFWGVFDSSATMDEVIASYRATQPKVNVIYRQIDPANYESTLINALASGNAPDVIMFHSTWLPKHVNKIQSFSAAQMPMDKFRTLFPTVAEQDFAPDGAVYALPLYIDTLALYYNQDIFDNSGIAVPPKTWEDFEKLIPKVRILDKLGRVQRAAVALGGSNRSINRGTDILSLLMLQTGTQMVNEDFTLATFSSERGLNALNFYAKFANPISPLYTWSDVFPNSLDSFASGDTAMIFNYSYQAEYLKEKNPFLNFRVIPMLQPATSAQDVNYANYWGVAVTVGSKNKPAAQDFALKISSEPTISEKYLSLTNRPPALRSLISKYANDPDVGVFAKQALTARSWPQIDNTQVDQILSSMIQSALANRLSNQKALEEAAGKITGLMQQTNK